MPWPWAPSLAFEGDYQTIQNVVLIKSFNDTAVEIFLLRNSFGIKLCVCLAHKNKPNLFLGEISWGTLSRPTMGYDTQADSFALEAWQGCIFQVQVLDIALPLSQCRET